MIAASSGFKFERRLQNAYLRILRICRKLPFIRKRYVRLMRFSTALLWMKAGTLGWRRCRDLGPSPKMGDDRHDASALLRRT
jgi:hypothetical protein